MFNSAMPPVDPKAKVKKTTTDAGVPKAKAKKKKTTAGVRKKAKRVKNATTVTPKDEQTKKKKKKSKEPRHEEEHAQEERGKSDFAVSPTVRVADWETGKKQPNYLKNLPRVDLQRAIFLPYPTQKIWVNVWPYPRKELESARARLIEGLQCNSPVLSRVKLKCGILPDGRRFAIPPPSLNPQDEAQDLSTSSLPCTLPARRRGDAAACTVTSQGVEDPALVEPDPDAMVVKAQGAAVDREHPPSDQYAGLSVTSRVLLTQSPANLPSDWKPRTSGSSSASKLDGGFGRKRPKNESCGESYSQDLSTSRTPELTHFMSEDQSALWEKVQPDATGRMPLPVPPSQATSIGSFKFSFSTTESEAFQDQPGDHAVPSLAGTSTQGFSFNFRPDVCSATVPDCPPSQQEPNSCTPSASIEGMWGLGPGRKAADSTEPTEGRRRPLSKNARRNKKRKFFQRRKKEGGNPEKGEGGRVKMRKKKRKDKAVGGGE